MTIDDLRRGDIIGIIRDERTHTWITRAIVEHQREQGLAEPQAAISHVGVVVAGGDIAEMVPPHGRIALLADGYKQTRAMVYRYDFTGADAERLHLRDMICARVSWSANAPYNTAGVAAMGAWYLRWIKPFSIKHAKFCSQLIADVFRECGYPLVEELGEDCTPAELCLSKKLQFAGFIDL